MRCSACVLVVEDDAGVREALREHLEGLGCKVVLAADGVDALDRLGRVAPLCFVLTDLTMPNLGGLDLARRMRANQRHVTLPILTMSSERRPEGIPEVDEHFEKPFVLPQLDRTAARLCRGGPARWRGFGLEEPEHE